ncbi:choice-of-anchor Q domain-containing protein [Lysobacter changpingensis]|uniref:choice-of-anchor Q domain-containing protein n=1 Tax=Lysobacter changpingensis TaxID=2792784 RepID=UPI001A8D231E|nr:choice-of-anchor Q domain-containing protein [Lysobacter changpingensis]
MSRHASTSMLLCAASLAAGAFLPVAGAQAATRVVANCNDSGAGSLRGVIAGALSGDVIDLRSLACTRIALTSGEIAIAQNNLTLIGRSRDAMTLDARQSSRVLRHTGTGTLRLQDLTVAWGDLDPVPGEVSRGGCIASDGNVELHLTRIHHCRNAAGGWLDSPAAAGGGINALGNVTVTHSSVFLNVATSNSTGGGIDAEGRVTLLYSHVFDNYAFYGGGVRAGQGASVTYSTVRDNDGGREGGGLLLETGDLLVNKSTFSNNRLHQDPPWSQWPLGGGLYADGVGARTIVDSTFSGNEAVIASAAYIEGDARINNSTIAFNIAKWGDDPPTPPCEERGALWADTLTLYSTIVANNPCTNGVGYDVGMDAPAILGADNLIVRANVAVPADTITADPRLAPLSSNGGPSRTHMLLSGSPAIDHGNNFLSRAYDQRGPGFPRVKGAFPDIGAIER